MLVGQIEVDALVLKMPGKSLCVSCELWSLRRIREIMIEDGCGWEHKNLPKAELAHPEAEANSFRLGCLNFLGAIINSSLVSSVPGNPTPSIISSACGISSRFRS